MEMLANSQRKFSHFLTLALHLLCCHLRYSVWSALSSSPELCPFHLWNALKNCHWRNVPHHCHPLRIYIYSEWCNSWFCRCKNVRTFNSKNFRTSSIILCHLASQICLDVEVEQKLLLKKVNWNPSSVLRAYKFRLWKCIPL